VTFEGHESEGWESRRGVRTGEKEPADGELVKFDADSCDAIAFDAVECSFGDAIERSSIGCDCIGCSCTERSVTECNGTACRITKVDDVECSAGDNVGSRSVGSRSRIVAVAVKNERSFSVIAREGRARCTGLSNPKSAPIARLSEVQVIRRRHQFEAMLRGEFVESARCHESRQQ
jgi:hypothetical protein